MINNIKLNESIEKNFKKSLYKDIKRSQCAQVSVASYG